MKGWLHSGLPRNSGKTVIRPEALLDATTVFVVAAAAISVVMAPQGLVLPAFATIMLAGGGLLGAYAWYHNMRQQRPLSVWDISGSLLALGFVAAVLSDTSQIYELVSL